MSGIGSCEDLRLSLEPDWFELALAAGAEDDDAAEAAVALGLHPRAEPDAPGRPWCDWCGRTGPPGGLDDISAGGPPAYECNDADDCARARAAALPGWLDHQYAHWKRDWERVEESRRWVRGLEGKAWAAYHPQDYAGWRSEVGLADPEFLAALDAVRLAVEHNLSGYAAAGELKLAASWPGLYDQPAEPAGFARLCHDSTCEHKTMRCPDNRTHTLGHLRTLKGASDSAAAIAHRNVAARSA